MLAHVGLDPRHDVNFVAMPPDESMRRLAAGEIDAFMAFPPEPQELRAKKVGRVIVNTTLDRPWSQYFCCTVVANREFVRPSDGHEARVASDPEGQPGLQPRTRASRPAPR